MTKECQQQKSAKFVKNLFSVLVICCLMFSPQILLASTRRDSCKDFCTNWPDSVCTSIPIATIMGGVAVLARQQDPHPILFGTGVALLSGTEKAVCKTLKKWYQPLVDDFCDRICDGIFGFDSIDTDTNITKSADPIREM